MIEIVKGLQEAVENKNENIGGKLELPEAKRHHELMPTDEQLLQRAELSAQLACRFFELPENNIHKGQEIQIFKNDTEKVTDDVMEYNVEQFKRMGCTSVNDMTRVWFHECGHRVLQDVYPDSWTDELGADFFVGIASELLGFPKGNLERLLAIQNPSDSHPGGSLRLMAIDYGRFVAAQMKEQGITPTWANCIEAFKGSPFPELTPEEVPAEEPSKGTRFYGTMDPSPVTFDVPMSVSSVDLGESAYGRIYYNPPNPYTSKIDPYPMTPSRALELDVECKYAQSGIYPTTPAGKSAIDFAKQIVNRENIKFHERQEAFERARDRSRFASPTSPYIPSYSMKENKYNHPSKIELFKTDIASRIKMVKAFFDFRHLDWKPFKWFMPKEHPTPQDIKYDQNNHSKPQMNLSLTPPIGEFAEYMKKKEEKNNPK